MLKMKRVIIHITTVWRYQFVSNEDTAPIEKKMKMRDAEMKEKIAQNEKETVTRIAINAI